MQQHTEGATSTIEGATSTEATYERLHELWGLDPNIGSTISDFNIYMEIHVQEL